MMLLGAISKQMNTKKEESSFLPSSPPTPIKEDMIEKTETRTERSDRFVSL